MTTQPTLFEAHARRTDPKTSHEAASSVRRIRESQADVLTIIRKYGPIPDEELIKRYRSETYAGKFRWQSESGIRTRRKELVDLGIVVDSGVKGRTASHRKTVLWKVK